MNKNDQKSYFQDLKKAFQANKTWYPEHSDQDGMDHPENPSRVKHTAVNGKPVWKYNEETSNGHEQAFMGNYEKFMRKTTLSQNGNKLLHSLIRGVVKDPDKHVIGAGTTPNAPKGHQEMRLRHLGAAMAGKHGYSIEESEAGLHVTAPRHSKSDKSNLSASQWTWNGQNLKHDAVKKMLKNSSEMPISSYQQGETDANRRTTKDSRRQPFPEGRRDGSRSGGPGDDGRIRSLNKGSARKIHGKFDQTKELTEDQAENMKNWINEGDPDQREDIPEASAGAKHRIFNKLMSRTESRRNPETSQVEFLLHRQMGPKEVDKYLKGNVLNHDNHSSWTYNQDKAHSGIYSRSDFDEDDTNYNHVVSAWIPSTHIHSMPTQYGGTGTNSVHESTNRKPENISEGEVIVKPNHNSQVHDILQSDHPTKWDFKSKIAKGQNGDWKKEGYELYSMPNQQNPDKFVVYANHPEHGDVGYARFKIVDDNYLAPDDDPGEHRYDASVFVDNDHARKGLASAMYQHAEQKAGLTVRPSEQQSESGEKLWANPKRSFGKTQQRLLGKAIAKSTGNPIEFNPAKYWSMVIPDEFYTNAPMLIKGMRIRTEGRLFVALDGDNIGASVERAAMADDLDTIISQSEKIAAGQSAIRKWAKSHHADIYIDGGDDIAFTIPSKKVKDLDELREIYNKATDFTVTIGVGETISKAGHAMLYGKLNGKDQVNEWSEKVDTFLAETSRKLTPEEKLADHGLLPGGVGDNTKIKDVDRDELREGVRHEMEHTNDPQVAVEIALDHLTEDPKYYTKLADLEKGSFQRRKPYNPRSQENIDQFKGSNKPREWIQGHLSQDSREAWPRIEGNARERGLHKLSGMTETRVDKEGKRSFLLHRGVGQSEHNKMVDKDTNTSRHKGVFSWTPDHSVATQFSGDQNMNRTLSAWVHEDDIHAIPTQTGLHAFGKRFGKDKHSHEGLPRRLKNEKEILVAGKGSQQLEDPQTAFKLSIPHSEYDSAEGETRRPVMAADGYEDDVEQASLNTRINQKIAKSDNNRLRDIADKYAASKGLKLDHGSSTKVDPDKATKIAQAYHEMEHNPHHPKVQAAYGAMIKETSDQFQHLKDSGLKISRIEDHHDNPYPRGSKDMLNDLHNNNHLWYYPTDSGFGSDEEQSHSDHPLLQPSDHHHEGKPLLANDVFRIVHDVFGHGKEGSSFGPHGEENAWGQHMQMYSPLAQKALTSETRGQNSWVNFGPHGENNRKDPANTVYANQKAGLLPDWASESNTPETPNLLKSEDDSYMDLVHFSNTAGLENLSSSHQGSAGAGREDKNISSSRSILDAQKRDYKKQPYLHTYVANTGDAESMFNNAPAKYHIRMPKDKIYDLSQDKLGIFEQVKNDHKGLYAPGEHAISHPDLVHSKIRDAGFLGFKVGSHPDSRFRDSVMFYHDVPVIGKDHHLRSHDDQEHTGVASEFSEHDGWGSTNLKKGS